MVDSDEGQGDDPLSFVYRPKFGSDSVYGKMRKRALCLDETCAYFSDTLYYTYMELSWNRRKSQCH